MNGIIVGELGESNNDRANTFHSAVCDFDAEDA